MSDQGGVHHKYFPFVDGLRAISIIVVVGFHVGAPGFPGGFVGVDVFFVISGFLIVNQIRDGLAANRFSIFDFYARRALRILPPYFVVLAAVFLAAPFLLVTIDSYADFARAALLSPIMVSNVLFYLRQGYFDITATEKPLLHTWTLSVEEQFYLVVPLLLVVLFLLGRRRFGSLAFGVALAALTISFAGCVTQTTAEGRNAAFYLAHWRAWEFILGGLIGSALVARLRPWPRAVKEAMAIGGLLAILVAVMMFDERMLYPSWRAALPVCGAAVLIAAMLADPHGLIGRALSSRVFVAIGLVSYGWYLWHWPILSFLRISRMGEPSLLPDALGAGLGGLLLAALSLKFIERPVRHWGRALREASAWRVVALGVVGCVTMAMLGGVSSYLGHRGLRAEVASRFGTEGHGVLDNGCRIMTQTTIPDACLDGPFAVLLGDSHADALSGSFTRILHEQGVRLVTIARGGCNPTLFAPEQRTANRTHGCVNLIGPFERVLAQKDRLTSVIVTSAWTAADERAFSDLLAQFQGTGTRVLVIGPVPIFDKPSLACVILSDRFGGGRERCTASRARVEASRKAAVDVLEGVAHRFDDVRFADPIGVFCDGATCSPFEGDRLFYRDAGHVLPQGAERIYAAFKADFGWLLHDRAAAGR